MEELFKSLSEKNRLRIVSILLENEMCVCEIECILKMTQSNVSRHLSALRKSGILESYKNAQWTYYGISEKFKKEHTLLWNYLNDSLKKLDTYKTDIALYEQCKANKICCTSDTPY